MPKAKITSPGAPAEAPLPPTSALPKVRGKLGAMVELMRRAEGASITQLIEAMGWLENSVRGALAGSLKRRGLLITSEKAGNVRVYRVAEPASSSGSAAEAPAPSAQP